MATNDTTTSQPTARQLEYLDSLRARALETIAASRRGVFIGRDQLIGAHLVANLPVPTTRDEASTLIDAATGSTIRSYSRAHREWAEPIVRAVGAEMGWN
jgi:hypothetical protein